MGLIGQPGAQFSTLGSHDSLRGIIKERTMHGSQGDTIGASENQRDLRFYLTREPLILALLSALAVVLFLAVGGLSRIYHAQHQSLGNRWFTRGAADLKDRRFDRAVSEFRAALLYSRDSYDYQ